MATQGTSDPNNQETVSTQLRRGDTAMGTDGRLGTVEQIVVDQETGEQRGIVIRRDGDGAAFEVPVEQVAQLAPGELHLKLARADLDDRPDLAHPYDPDQYVPVYPGGTPPQADATRLAQDTGHPVVTNVEENAAELVAPQQVVATDTAVDAPTAPRAQAQQPPTDTAVPIVGGNEPTRVLSRGDGGVSAGLAAPRHTGPGESREQMQDEVIEGPATEPSPIESTSGELIGGRPTTGGVGAAATPTSETTPPQDTAGSERDSATFAAPAQRATGRAGSARAMGDTIPPDLAALTDDELANPDAALATNPQPGTAAAVAAPYQPGVVRGAPESGARPGGSFPSDQTGMADVFAKATNTAADDTWVNREPEALTETDRLPAGESGPRYDAEDITRPPGAAADEAWRPSEVPAETGAAPVASPTSQSPYNQLADLRPQPALRANAPSQASAEAEAEGAPAWIASAAAGLGAALLLGGVAVGAVVALRRRREGLRSRVKRAPGVASEGIAATATTALARAQELTEGVLKPADQQAAETTERARRRAKAPAREAKREAKAQIRKGAAQAQEGARDAQKQVRRTANRAARRARWFRRGLILGAATAVLFAPASGEDLRTQLASRIEQWRSRAAS